MPKEIVHQEPFHVGPMKVEVVHPNSDEAGGAAARLAAKALVELEKTHFPNRAKKLRQGLASPYRSSPHKRGVQLALV